MGGLNPFANMGPGKANWGCRLNTSLFSRRVKSQSLGGSMSTKTVIPRGRGGVQGWAAHSAVTTSLHWRVDQPVSRAQKAHACPTRSLAALGPRGLVRQPLRKPLVGSRRGRNPRFTSNSSLANHILFISRCVTSSSKQIYVPHIVCRAEGREGGSLYNK